MGSADYSAPFAGIINNHYVALFLSRCANRRFLFSIAATAILSAKAVHIYAHLSAMIISELWIWGLSFFAQDTILLLTLHLLLDKNLFEPIPWLASTALGIASTITVFSFGVATCNISFFSLAGNEIHWRNVGILADPSSFDYLLIGLVSFIATFVGIIIIAWVAQDAFYCAVNLTLDIIEWPLKLLWTKFVAWKKLGVEIEYTHLEQQELEPIIEEEEEFDLGEKYKKPQKENVRRKWIHTCYMVIGLILLAQVVQLIARPIDPSFIFVSWTLPLIPFVDLLHSSNIILGMLPEYGAGVGLKWDNLTALGKPIDLAWLPQDKTLPGFEDWYFKNTTHYRANKDPLKISNLDSQLLPKLKKALAGIKIRHVMLVKLESTRRDVFPFKKDSSFWRGLSRSFPDGQMPLEAQKRLAHLTPTANFITGDYTDGFNHKTRAKRGGINFKAAHTSSSYTLKSLTATLCGLAPLVADWNVEIENHFYQPCLPHILNAFNGFNNSESKKKGKDDFTRYKWKSLYMQSCTGRYDRQQLQMPLLGYKNSDVIDFQYLIGPSAKHGTIKPEQGSSIVPESTLEPYLRDAFASAKRKNERLFLTHLTSTTHGPFKLYEENLHEEVAFAGDSSKEMASKYLNTIGYVDKWLARLLKILDEEGVADETLVIFMGDHGLSVAEVGGVTPYYAWRNKAFHIPLVLSHPKLPPMDITDPVVSMQVLPTILDILRETGSLPDQANKAALDLMRNYEGQSLLRRVKKSSEKTGQPNWQFTVTNPGKSLISVSDPQHPNRHLAVPVIENVAWRFTADLRRDETEMRPVAHFSYRGLVHQVEARHGVEMAEWVESAAFAARWWMKDVQQRWRYDSGE